MPHESEAWVDMVIQAIETAVSPIVERLAAAEARLAAIGDLRDRVVAVETKAAQPLPAPDLGDVRNRLVVLETKYESAAGKQPDTDRALLMLSELRDRVVAVETKAAQPIPLPDLGDVRDRLVTLETKLTDIPTAAAYVETQTQVVSLLAVRDQLGGVRERLAVLETRAPVPGPAGQNGADGKDGADGLGFEDLAVEYDGDRTIALKFSRGEQRRVFPIQLPMLKFEGVYQEGREYAKGDVVTWAGASWHCNAATVTKPGDGAKAWTLMVKKGRDGQDGRDGRDLVPVVKVGG